MTAEPEVTTISEKGQVVIPQSIRRELGINPKTNFSSMVKAILSSRKNDLPDLKKE
jgi:bifunctional DNA-binding transcriptional regulator/antitoxin component of YhaV-PrlF toxin-antitoxin module